MLEVIIASTRRPQALHDTLESLSEQSSPPDRVVLSLVQPDDFDGRWPKGLTGITVIEAAGASAQRNAGIRHLLPGTRVVVFLDDDVTLAPDCLGNGEVVFRERPDLMILSGTFLRDGGIGHPEARELLIHTPRPASAAFTPASSCYGCLLFVRRILLEKETFDERLSGYSFLEDVDFARRGMRHGQVGHFSGAVYVHLRIGSGRVNDRQFGYTQMVNPFYLYRKGSLHFRELGQCWFSGLASNVVFSFLGQFWGRVPTDYRRRLTGNLKGLWELLLGKAAPERCLLFK
jgi:glycosyltransferase involved in cell wall biosynthesis